MRVQVEPALDMEQLLETTAELAHEGNTLRSGMPKPLHLALFVQRFKREVRAPFPPAWLVGARWLRCGPSPARAGTTRAIPRSLRWRSALLFATTLAALSAPPASARTETLFDGRSLKGWRHAGDAPLRLQGRTIRSASGSGELGLLYYARKRYRDFQLSLEFKAAEGANSGVHLRFPEPGGCSWIDCGYEVQINDTAADTRKTGSIYGFADLDAQHAHTRPPGTWTRLRIRAQGPDVHRLPRWQAHQPLRRQPPPLGLHRPAGARRPSGHRRVPGHPDPRALSRLPHDRVAARRHLRAQLDQDGRERLAPDRAVARARARGRRRR